MNGSSDRAEPPDADSVVAGSEVAGSVVAGFDGSDGSEDALALAVWLAKGTGDPLDVVCAYPSEPLTVLPGVGRDWAGEMQARAQDTLDRARRILQGESIACYHAVGASSAARGLDRFADARGARVLVLGSSHRGAFHRVSASTTAHRLMHGAAVPVLVAPRGTRDQELPPAGTVGCAYVPGPESDHALAEAATLAMQLDAHLTLFTVLAHGAELPVTDPYLEEAFLLAARERLTAGVGQALTELPSGVSATSRMLEGRVVDGLAALEPPECDLLVCGSRGYGPVRRVLLGGVSGRLVRRASCPVMVVPRGDDP